MLLFSKRFAGMSLLMLVSLFLPWFKVDVIITTSEVHGYGLGFVGVLLIILSLLGITASSIQMRRFRGLVEAVIGALTLLFMWIGRVGFYSRLTSTLNDLAGGSSSDGGQQMSSLLGGTDFGFYVGLIAALALLIFGLHAVLSFKSEVLVPEDWRVVFSRERMGKIQSSVAQAAAAMESTVVRASQRTASSGMWGKVAWRTKTGKALWSVVGIAAVYGISALVYNSTHGSTAMLKSFVADVNSGNASQVGGMLDETESLLPDAVSGFVTYYQTHTDQLQILLASVASGDGSEDNLSSIFGSQATNSPVLVKKNFMGFVHYKLQLPEVQLQLSGPQGVAFKMNGKTIPSNGFVLPAVYPIQAVVDSALGKVVDTHTEDATQSGNIQDHFQFQNDIIAISMAGIPDGNVSLSINGKSVQAQFSGGNATIGPLPVTSNMTLNVTFQEPWGPFVESGQVQNGQCQLDGDPTANLDLAKSLASVINDFNQQDTQDTNSGDYTPELKYLAPNSPAYQGVQGKSGSSSMQYLGMVVSPVMELTTIGDSNEVGLNISDTEQYTNPSDPASGSNGIDWTYTMQYDPASKTWAIYDNEQTYNDLSAGGGNFSPQ